MEQIQNVALDRSLADRDRVAAVEMLAYQPFKQSAAAFERLLGTSQPLEVQLACVRAMGASSQSAAIVLERWPTLGPTVRGPALRLLLGRKDTLGLALKAMADGKINPAVIGLDQRIRLLRHRDDKLRSLATKLFGGAVSANRREVAQQYEPALKMTADPVVGAKVFQRTCAKCHKLDGQGHEVGPDISDVRNRSYEALLYDILDPNRKLEPRYTDYSVVTEDGRVLNGLMISETAEAVILRQAEGKQEVVARSQIEEIRASGKSLMPEGVEKEVSIQQMADLLAYLKSQGQPAPAAGE
jgi:putative heme-binding domain-containing protein